MAGRGSRGDPATLQSFLDTAGLGTAKVEILQTQTTWLSLQLSAGRVARVHYDGKLERDLRVGHVSRISLPRAHPLIVDYQYPIQRVFLSSAPRDVDGFMQALRDAATATIEGWRSIERHWNGYETRATIAGGYGELLRGPTPLVERVLKVVADHGVTVLVKQCSAAHPAVELLLLDRFFVIAKGSTAEWR